MPRKKRDKSRYSVTSVELKDMKIIKQYLAFRGITFKDIKGERRMNEFEDIELNVLMEIGRKALYESPELFKSESKRLGLPDGWLKELVARVGCYFGSEKNAEKSFRKQINSVKKTVHSSVQRAEVMKIGGGRIEIHPGDKVNSQLIEIDDGHTIRNDIHLGIIDKIFISPAGFHIYEEGECTVSYLTRGGPNRGGNWERAFEVVE